MLNSPWEGGYEGSSIEYYIYPEFQETLRFLEQKGVQARQETDFSDIVSVQAEIMEPSPGDISEIYPFEDPDEIRELFQHLERIRPSDFQTGQEYVNLNLLFWDGTYGYMEFKVRDQEAFQKFLSKKGEASF